MKKFMMLPLVLLMLLLAACSDEGEEYLELEIASNKIAGVAVSVTEKELVSESDESLANAHELADESLENESTASEYRSDHSVDKLSKQAESKTSSKADLAKSPTSPSKMTVVDTKSESKTETAVEPAHTHTWTPVYSERSVQKVRKVAWTKCYACGADMTGNISHIDKHLQNHETNVHYGTEYRDEIYYETETYISGYKCTCGATK